MSFKQKIPENSYIRNVNERYVDAFFNKIPIHLWIYII